MKIQCLQDPVAIKEMYMPQNLPGNNKIVISTVYTEMSVTCVITQLYLILSITGRQSF